MHMHDETTDLAGIGNARAFSARMPFAGAQGGDMQARGRAAARGAGC